MNNHWHFYVQTKLKKLGYLLGDAWLMENQQYKEYYVAMYFRDSWRNIPSFLKNVW
jgi:hypothetical protein